jgi:aspartate kinase
LSSAMGDTTDHLLRLIKKCSDTPPVREIDQLIATGEQVSISLLATILQKFGIKARSLTAAQAGITSDSFHGKARVTSIDGELLLGELADNQVLVVAGFQAIATNGDTTTLGRGGSDTSAVAIAVAVGAACCDIYTDVDGIFTANPAVITSARLLRQISYADAGEMARLGSQVIHPRAVSLASRNALRLRVRNTFNPQDIGTAIEGEQEVETYQAVTGIAVDANQAIIAVRNIPIGVDIASSVFELLAKNNITTDLISHGIKPRDGIVFTVSGDDVRETLACLDSLKFKYPQLEIDADEDCAKVSLIGSGIADRAGIAAKLFTVLAKQNINVKLTATGERRLTCVVDNGIANVAARALHDAFQLHEHEHTCILSAAG